MVIAAIALMLLLIISVILWLDNVSNNSLSQPQEDTVKSFGYPQQFTVLYLPQGQDKPVRTEYWYYPQYKMKITFLNGLVYAVEEHQVQNQSEPTDLKPQDIDLHTSLAEVEELVGKANYEPVDFLPGFFEAGQLETYISSQALFAYENGSLTFFQTVELPVNK